MLHIRGRALEHYLRGVKVEIGPGWDEEGKVGIVLGPSITTNGISWTSVLWEGEDDPDFFKTRGLTLARKVGK